MKKPLPRAPRAVPAKPAPAHPLAEEVRPGQSLELLKELHILTREGKLNQDSRRKLKQVLTRAPGGTNEVFTISGDEALKIEAQIQRIMDARQKALEQTKPIIIER